MITLTTMLQMASRPSNKFTNHSSIQIRGQALGFKVQCAMHKTIQPQLRYESNLNHGSNKSKKLAKHKYCSEMSISKVLSIFANSSMQCPMSNHYLDAVVN